MRHLPMTSLASLRLYKISSFKHLSLSLRLKGSQNPFSHGDPGSMLRFLVPRVVSHSRRTFATISGPLSERMWTGIPLIGMASASVSMTPMALMFLAHGWPSTCRYTHRSASSGGYDPSLSQRRARLGCKSSHGIL